VLLSGAMLVRTEPQLPFYGCVLLCFAGAERHEELLVFWPLEMAGKLVSEVTYSVLCRMLTCAARVT